MVMSQNADDDLDSETEINAELQPPLGDFKSNPDQQIASRLAYMQARSANRKAND